MIVRSLLLASALVATLPAFARADEISAQGVLKSATVYTGRATLTRQAVVEIPAGAHTVVFSGLPANLMPDSLRAEGSAAVSVIFGALTSKVVTGVELTAPREKELTDKLESLQDQRRGVEMEKQALSAQLDFLKSLSEQAGQRTRENIADINLKPEEWSGAAGTIYKNVSETLKAYLAQDVALRTLDRQIAQVQGELDQLRTGQRSTYEVTLPLETQTATRLTVHLSYQVPDATWMPLYDARLNTQSGKLDLVQYGSVRQNTGEDWTGISLTLSTAQPQRGTGLPNLTPLWVGLLMPQPMMLQNAARMSAMDSVAGSAMMEKSVEMAAPAAAPVPERQAEFAVAQIETGGFVSEYKIPGPATVKADGTESKLMIGAFKTDSKLQIEVKPQMSTDAFLTARAKLLGEAPILPGPVSLFRDGAYVGSSDLPLLRPGQEQSLPFGIDDQIAVARKILKDERSEVGLIGRDAVLERNFVTELQNLHTQKVDVVVLETIPAAQDKQIRVELLPEQTTTGYDQDVDNVKGQLRWTVPMDPKAKADVKLGWKVSWPKDQTLTGL